MGAALLVRSRAVTTANSGVFLWGNAAGNGYAYDKMGNVTSITLGRTAAFTYSGTLPKLSSVTESVLGTRSVSYDAAANETAVGASTFAYSTRNNLATADGLTYTYDGRGLRTIVQDGSGNKRYFFYLPEMNLLEETSFSPTPTTAGGYDYVWFNGHPVAEKDGGTHWTFTDHLGTPLIQTDLAGTVFWRAEHEPYGSIFTLRTGDQHQPLRLPGQEAEQLNLGPNGVTERSYNIFRWYRSTWSRYTQPDPLSQTLPIWQATRGSAQVRIFLSKGQLRSGNDQLFLSSVLSRELEYTYVEGNPIRYIDPSGLDAVSGGGAFGAQLGCAYAMATALSANGVFPAGTFDKYKHCVVSCLLAEACGPAAALAMGLGKEFRDLFGSGTPEFQDVVADVAGIRCADRLKGGRPCPPPTCDPCCSTKYPLRGH